MEMGFPIFVLEYYCNFFLLFRLILVQSEFLKNMTMGNL